MWVYRSDIVSADAIAPGSLVGVTDERGKLLGTALYSSTSQIAIRLISPDPVADFPACSASALPTPSPTGSLWCATPMPIASSSAKPIFCPD